MKKYIARSSGLFMALAMTLIVSMFLMHSCAEEIEEVAAGHNFSMDFSTRAGEVTAAGLIPKMRLFTFTESTGMFHGEVLNITRTQTKLTAKVEAGNKWNMAMISSPDNFTLVAPTSSAAMDNLPMYIYNPTTSGGKTESAPELFFQNKLTPQINANVTQNMDAQLNRAVAKVEIIIRKATPNFNLVNGVHKIELHDVPTTLSYTGKLLPGKANPTVLSESLKSPVTLVTSTANPGFLESETIEFIIPAHQGTDFLSDNPTDVIGKKMRITVDLERAGGGSRFTKTEEIDKVALCNRILRVLIDVNDGVSFQTSVLPWERVDITSNVGTGYQNWLYVKKDATGSGMSWSDPIGNINTAITKATALIGAGKTVHGILVAGGETLLYNEGVNVLDGIKIYGGWSGTPTQELQADDKYAAYKSSFRDLKKYKARLNLIGNNSVRVSGADALLDGFIINNATTASGDLVTVGNASSVINAIEITNNTTASGSVLNMTAGTASNVLIADNARGISISGGAKLINTTVANNAATSTINGATILNTAFWKSAHTMTGTNTINNSAFQVTTHSAIPSGTANISLNQNNTAWFNASSSIPGPHFNENNGTLKYYEALNDRCPLVGRGAKTNFDENTSYIPDGFKKDIDGNDRHIQNTTSAFTDIGCYEAAGTYKGFIMRWASESIYVSARSGYTSQLALLLPENETHQIGVNWTVSIQGNTLTESTFNGPYSGYGEGIMVGHVAVTPTVTYTGSNERQLGVMTIGTDLGPYLRDAEIKVMQNPGTNTPWTVGYVGSFHRNNERGARFINAYNSGAWTARIVSGLDWIKLDVNDKTYGADITDPDEGKTPSGTYYKEVEEEWGGVVSGTGYIKFRVGMKSKNPNPEPRYGLIIITRSAGVAMFFVRQGEAPDLLYREGNPRVIGNSTLPRNRFVPFATYNLTDPSGNTAAAGKSLTRNTVDFVDYPSQIGYYFKFNQTTAYMKGKASGNLLSTSYSTWDNEREICPPNYRHPSQEEYLHTIYDRAQVNTAHTNRRVEPTVEESKFNFMWGAYADGYYDQLAPVPLANSATNTYVSLDTPKAATKGILMVSHYDYGSVFFPAGGTLGSDGKNANPTYVMQYCSGEIDYGSNTNGSGVSNSKWLLRNSHWTNGHIGMDCTSVGTASAATVRCVYVGP